MGNKPSAERLMARPIPAPQWLSRVPRLQPKIQMVGAVSPRPSMAVPDAYSTVVPLSPPRAERGTQALLQDVDTRPPSRAVAPSGASAGGPDAVPAPEPTAPIAQSP
jgi:hypothetical protein